MHFTFFFDIAFEVFPSFYFQFKFVYYRDGEGVPPLSVCLSVTPLSVYIVPICVCDCRGRSDGEPEERRREVISERELGIQCVCVFGLRGWNGHQQSRLSFKLSMMCVRPAGASTPAPYLCQNANHSSGGSDEECGHASMCQRGLQYKSYYLTIADPPPVYKSLSSREHSIISDVFKISINSTIAHTQLAIKQPINTLVLNFGV